MFIDSMREVSLSLQVLVETDHEFEPLFRALGSQPEKSVRTSIQPTPSGVREVAECSSVPSVCARTMCGCLSQ